VADLLKQIDSNILTIISDKAHELVINTKKIASARTTTFETKATLCYLLLFKDTAKGVKIDSEGVFAKLKWAFPARF